MGSEPIWHPMLGLIQSCQLAAFFLMRKRTDHPGAHRRLSAAIIGMLLALPLVAAPAHAEPSQGQLDRAIEDLGRMQQQQEVIIEQYNTLAEQLKDTKAALAIANADYDRYSGEADQAQTELDLRTREIYTSGLNSRLDAFFGSSDYSDFSDRITYLSAIADANQASAADASVSQQKADWAREAAQKAQAEEQKQEDELAAKKKQIEAGIAKQEALVAKLKIEYAAALAAWENQQAAPSGPDGTGPPQMPDEGHTNPPPPSSAAATAIATARAQIGKPYKWAASGPDSFDCSGLTMFAWNSAGVSLPHSSFDQFNDYPHVSKDQLQSGDLVFFDTDGDGVINHVALYIGGGSMIQADSGGVGVGLVFSGYYGARYVGASRPG